MAADAMNCVRLDMGKDRQAIQVPNVRVFFTALFEVLGCLAAGHLMLANHCDPGRVIVQEQ